VVRNWIVLGQPVLTTTHGGYTLLLGNNPVFYREVVAKPWGTVWHDAPPEATQSAWFESINSAMLQADPPVTGELDRDRWMFDRAMATISEQPGQFLSACQLRFLRFWNVVPLGPSAESVPPLIRKGTAMFYGVVTLGLVVGLFRLRRHELETWMPVLLLLASFTLVHLVYWSNARMRAPLVPAIALLTVRGFQQSRCRKAKETDAATSPRISLS
jgi:hypothetical protein